MFKINLLDLAEELNISPIDIPKELFRRQCQRKITYEADTECFCVEVLKITKNISDLVKSILTHMWNVESNSLSKLSATYILCRQSSYPSVEYLLRQQKKEKQQETGVSFIKEQLEKSSALIHQLNNVYFNSLEEECETLLAGSEEEKKTISPIAHFNSIKEKQDVENDIQTILKQSIKPLNQVDIFKILFGIGSNRINPNSYKGYFLRLKLHKK